MGEQKHGGGGYARENGLPIGKSSEDGVNITVSDGRTGIYYAECLTTKVGIRGAPGLLDQPLFIAEMRERGVLYVKKILKDILGPRGINPPREIRAAENVAPGAVNAVPRSQTPRTKQLLALPVPGWQRRPVSCPDQPLTIELGRRIVRKHLFVTPREATIFVVDRLYRKRRLFLPWPKPQPGASDRHGATRGVDENAHACVTRGIQHVLRPLHVHFFGERQESDVALVEADIGRRVKDRRLRLDGRRAAAPGPRCAEGSLYLLSIGDVDKTKVDIFGRSGRQIGARGCANVQDSDLLRVFAALEQMADDPATEKASLAK